MKNKIDYTDLKITGMCYVREVKDEFGERAGYLLIDNKNKPVKDVFDYLKYRMKSLGDSLNTQKRVVFDLCYLYDFMLFNNIKIEYMDYNYFNDFISGYLIKIDPDYRVLDCIEKSMLKKIPILQAYTKDNITILDKNKSDGLSTESIQRICNNIKLYMIYLVNKKGKDIQLDNIFVLKSIRANRDNRLLGHIQKGLKEVYSVNGLLKAAKIPIRFNKGIKPIERECIFEDNEEKIFLSELSRNSSPMYQLLYYLLLVSGMRIAEALSLKVYEIPYIGKEIDLANLNSDILLKNSEEEYWEINIKVNPDNPKDLQIKGNKERTVPIVDSNLQTLLTQALSYRQFILKKKSKKTNNAFLFINRNGDRMKYSRVEQKFKEVVSNSGLSHRIGRAQLTLHSFRHTFASKYISILKANKMDIELDLLSKILGHSNPSTTRETYIHFFKDDINKVLKKMDQAMSQDGII